MSEVISEETGLTEENAVVADDASAEAPDRPSIRRYIIIGLLIVFIGFLGWGLFARNETQPTSGPAPNFTLTLFDGYQGNVGQPSIKLSDLRGKVVLINFWATWCGPCEIEIPWMIEFQQKYAARGFTVLGLAMDEEGQPVVAPWVSAKKFDVNGTPMAMDYPILLANEDVAEKFGGLIGLPTSLLISRDGKIIKRFIGLVSQEHYAQAIEENLK